METIRILGTVLVTGAASVTEYFWKGPKAESWSLQYHVFFKTIRNVAESGNGRVKPERLQELSRIPSFVPRNCKIEAMFFRRSKEAVDFCRGQAHFEWHHTANDVDNLVDAELIAAGEDFDPEQVIYMLHGGGYVMGSIQLNRQMAYRMAKRSKSRVFGPNYRLAPQHPFPCGLIDAISGYIFLLRQFEPQNIVLTGDSAGGGLCLSVLYAIRDMGLPMPAGAVLFSPWVDLTHSFPGFVAHGEFDYLPEKADQSGYPEYVGKRNHLYAPDNALNNPFVSPWYGSLEKLPPLLFQVGQKERLHEEDVAMYKKASESGVVSILEEYQDQVHVFQAFPLVTNRMARFAFDQASKFIRQVTGRDVDELISGHFFVDAKCQMHQQ
ncbi:Alpha/Beta hydrolase protein [Gorgonomyces haynaldii]|nr:Alpha/Beta hydrolase protein [Gorgonomyces haynaldii]